MPEDQVSDEQFKRALQHLAAAHARDVGDESITEIREQTIRRYVSQRVKAEREAVWAEAATYLRDESVSRDANGLIDAWPVLQTIAETFEMRAKESD